MREHPESGQSIFVCCSSMYLLLNVHKKFLSSNFWPLLLGSSSMIDVGVVPKCFFKKIECL